MRSDLWCRPGEGSREKPRSTPLAATASVTRVKDTIKGTTQACWKHQIPKTARTVGERVNLTFRVIVDPV